MLPLGRLHPALVHFPIALVLAAAAAEVVAIWTRRASWRTIAVVNVRAGAAVGAVTAVAGWALASAAPFIEPAALLAWHRWIGVAGAAGAIAAAMLSVVHDRSGRALVAYQAALFGAAILVAVSGHLGGTLVWGPDFMHP